MKLPLGGVLIRIDVDPAKLADHYGADVPIWGDARGALRSIEQRLTPRSGWKTAIGGAASYRSQIENGFDAKARAQLEALPAIPPALPRHGALSRDLTH